MLVHACKYTCVSFNLQDLYDFKFGVHDQYVLFLWFSLSLDCVSTRADDGRCGKEASSSQNYLGHQLPDSMNRPHHITA